MVKHTQTICCLLPANRMGVFDHFIGLELKWLNWLAKLKFAKHMFKVDNKEKERRQ